MPPDLATSASRMDSWLRDGFGLRAPGFVDHSGLGYQNAISTEDMVRFLSRTDRLEPLLEEHAVSEGGRTARAKTGTLNFTSALAGYLPAGNRRLAFAIFTADTARRDAIPPDQRERPSGAREWAARSRQLQRDLLKTWAVTLAG
jgi:serine-type D-Ala-D-Ala carboxypeptidase/endopeptidase (penicillin-binding protein 4)